MPNPTSIVVQPAGGGSTVTVSTLDAIAALVGEVQASPTALTLLDRLKTLHADLAAALPAGTNVIGKVGIDPANNTVATTAPSDNSVTGNLTAANQAVTLTGLGGRASVLLQLSGAFVGSVVVEYSQDNFATVKLASCLTPAGVSNAAQTAPGFYRYTGISGYPYARARCSAYTSGTIAAALVAGGGPDAETVISVVPQNFQVTDNGVYNTTLPTLAGGQYSPLQLDASGQLLVNPAKATTGNDSIQAGPIFGRYYDGAGNAYAVLRARATFATATAAQLVAATAGKKIQVVGYKMQCRAAGTPVVSFQDDSATPALLGGEWQLDQSGATGPNGVLVKPGPEGCDVDPTTVGQALTVLLTAAVSVRVAVLYILV